MEFRNIPGLYFAARVSYGFVLILFVVSCMINLVPTWVAEVVMYAYIGFLIYTYCKVQNEGNRRYRLNIAIMIAIMVIISFAPLYIDKLANYIAS